MGKSVGETFLVLLVIPGAFAFVAMAVAAPYVPWWGGMLAWIGGYIAGFLVGTIAVDAIERRRSR